MADAFVCPGCGKTHDIGERELGMQRPDAYWIAPRALRRKSRANSNFCVLAGRRYFIRGVLPLRNLDVGGIYCIGLWAEVSKDTFDRAVRVHRPRHFQRAGLSWGRIANNVARVFPQPLLNRRVAVRFNKFMRPFLFLRCSGHSLEREQRSGVSMHRLAEIDALAFGRDE